MPKLLIFDAFTLLIREKTVANYALLRRKTFSLKIWVCKIFDKFHVCPGCSEYCPCGNNLGAKVSEGVCMTVHQAITFSLLGACTTACTG